MRPVSYRRQRIDRGGRMDLLQFVSSLFSSLSWPATVIVLVVILRRPLGKMLSARPVRRLEAGPAGLKVEYLDKTLEDARSELADAHKERSSLPPPTNVVATETGDTEEDYMSEMKKLAEISPSAVVLESFARLERVLRDAVEPVQVNGQMTRRRSSVRPLARQAVERGILAPTELAAFDDVAALRNVVSHQRADDLDVLRALSYAGLVQQLIMSIHLATGRTVADGPAA